MFVINISEKSKNLAIKLQARREQEA